MKKVIVNITAVILFASLVNAVEVRRLNQNYNDSGKYKSLEQLSFPLQHKIEKMLSAIIKPNHDKSYFVTYSFRRPLGDINKVLERMKNTLIRFLENENEEINTFKINDRFTIRIFPSSDKNDDVFLLGAISDRDAGGFSVSEVYRNLSLCIAEKTQKIENYRHKYHLWWLIFIDYIGYGLTSRDLERLQEL